MKLQLQECRDALNGILRERGMLSVVPGLLEKRCNQAVEVCNRILGVLNTTVKLERGNLVALRSQLTSEQIRERKQRIDAYESGWFEVKQIRAQIKSLL